MDLVEVLPWSGKSRRGGARVRPRRLDRARRSVTERDPSPERLRLLLVADTYYPPTLGGSAIATRRLAHGLAGRGHEVTVLAPSPDFRNHLERDGQTVVVRCRSIYAVHLRRHANRRNIRMALFPEALVAQTIEDIRPDLVHVQVPAYIGAAAARVAQELDIPVVATCHALPENFLPSRNKDSLPFRAIESLFWDGAIKVMAECDLVLAPSRTAAGILTEHGLRKPVTPMTNGVDLRRFHPSEGEEERNATRIRLGLPLNVPLALYAGRLAREKRLDVLIRATRILADRGLPFPLGMTGAGSDEVCQLARELGIEHLVHFLGEVSDRELPAIYRAADVFVLPSEAELQGIALLEAAASGLALVGAEALAIPEIIRDGDNGFLHQPGNPEDLAEQLARVLGDPDLRQRLGRRSLEIVQEHSIDSAVARTEALYRAVLQQRVPGSSADARLA